MQEKNEAEALRLSRSTRELLRNFRSREAKREVTFPCGEATLHWTKPCFIFHARQRASFPKQRALLAKCSFVRHVLKKRCRVF